MGRRRVYSISHPPFAQDRQKSGAVAVEPDRENRRVLPENLRLNGYGDVLVIDTLVLRRAGAARLQRDPDKPSMSRIAVDSAGDLKGVGLDDLLANCPAPSLVKVDVDGLEGELWQALNA
jgi:FkbM family methyltransferase